MLIKSNRYDLRENVNQSALESWGDEFPISGVTKAPSRLVKPPRVAESPVSFECKVHSVVRIQGDSLVGHSDIVIGRVVGIHVKGEYITPDGVGESHPHSESFFILICFVAFWCFKSRPSGSAGVSPVYCHRQCVWNEGSPYAGWLCEWTRAFRGFWQSEARESYSGGWRFRNQKLSIWKQDRIR